jgi:hypothetical protein
MRMVRSGSRARRAACRVERLPASVYHSTPKESIWGYSCANWTWRALVDIVEPQSIIGKDCSMIALISTLISMPALGVGKMAK